MPIQYHKGNVFESKATVIFQGCNCFCTQASGLAKEMVARYPEALEADKLTIKGDRNKLGTLTLTEAKNENRILINLYTQYSYGLDTQHLDYAALTAALLEMREILIDINCTDYIASGRIGAGRAGGDWNKISKIIECIFPDIIIHIYDL